MSQTEPRRTVLVVEDDPALSEVLCLCVESQGYHFLAAQQKGAVEARASRLHQIDQNLLGNEAGPHGAASIKRNMLRADTEDDRLADPRCHACRA